MPTSEHWQIPWVVDLLIREQPRTVLDVGAGYGKYGVLVREYIEPARLDAVDVNPPRFPVYDHVYEGDLRRLEALLPGGAEPYDLALFIDLAQRAGMHGIQEWLSFYCKSPMVAEGLYPEHDIFIQLMKLKNTLRYLRGEDLITHLGLEYYD